MKLAIRVALAAAFLAATVGGGTLSAADTWTGKISDSMCNADHGANGGTMAKDHQCTLDCVKNGAQYVFVNGKDDKVYKIANQKFEGLPIHAGHTVILTGELKDNAITVTKIEMPKVR